MFCKLLINTSINQSICQWRNGVYPKESDWSGGVTDGVEAAVACLETALATARRFPETNTKLRLTLTDLLRPTSFLFLRREKIGPGRKH